MKKFSMLLGVFLLSTFFVIGSALALPINTNRPYTLGSSGEPSLQSILDDAFGAGTVDDYNDQSNKAVWVQDEGIVDAYFVRKYRGDSGVLGIYSFSNPTLKYDFVFNAAGTSDFLISDNGTFYSGTTTIAGFGQSFGYYWKDTSVPNMSYTEDDKNTDNTVLALAYLIADGTKVNLPTGGGLTTTAQGNNDWFLAFEDRLTGDNDFNDATYYIEDMRPVPEPATMLLLGTGLIGLAGVSRKKLFMK